MISTKKFDFLKVGLCGKLRVNFHFIVVKDTCTFRLFAVFEVLALASNETRLNFFVLFITLV